MDTLTLEQWAFTLWADSLKTGLSTSEREVAKLGWMARNTECEQYRTRITELEAQLLEGPRRLNTKRIGPTDIVFADIRAAFVDKDGTITRTLNGSIMPPGTDLYVLGDIIE